MPTADDVLLRQSARKIARQLTAMDKRLSAVERGPQLRYSSVTDKDGTELDVVQSLRTGVGAMGVANKALVSADGASTNYYNPTSDPPGDPKEGDTWFPPDAGYAPRRWDGAQWVPYAFGSDALAAGSVVAGTIDAGAVTADKLAANIVLASALIAGDPTSARVELSAAGLYAYDPDGSTIELAPGAQLRMTYGPNDPPTAVLEPMYFQIPDTSTYLYGAALHVEGNSAQVKTLGNYVELDGAGIYLNSQVFIGSAITNQQVVWLQGFEPSNINAHSNHAELAVYPDAAHEIHFSTMADGTFTGLYAPYTTGMIGLWWANDPQTELQVRQLNGVYQNIRASTFSQSSSEQLKTNISPLAAGSALSRVNATPIRRWQRTDEVEQLGDQAPFRIGPMAEDAPADTSATGDGTDAALDIGSMIGLLWAAVQEVDAKIGAK